MNLLHQLRHETSLKQPKWLVIPRIVLGGMLFIKGITFVGDSSHLESLIENSRLAGSFTPVLAGIIAWTHLLGGLFILTGLATRAMCLLQIPILLGAVLFINLPNFTLDNSAELWLSMISLVMLIAFVIEGSGKISADEYFRTYYKAGYHKVKVDV